MDCLVVWLSLQPKYMRFLSVFSYMVKYVRLQVTWFLLLRLEYGTFVESKLVLPFMTLHTAVLLTLHIFLQCLAAKFLALHRTTVFVYGTPYLAIWIHQAERLYTVMTLIAIWLLSKLNGIQGCIFRLELFFFCPKLFCFMFWISNMPFGSGLVRVPCSYWSLYKWELWRSCLASHWFYRCQHRTTCCWGHGSKHHYNQSSEQATSAWWCFGIW